ncbi:MAG: NADPH-dependent 7-cyano-7-deazaguanine reductase QueF [Pseudomonadota bacterium]|jgi:7-cyano-7-deazaguanine reductase
MSNPLGKIVPYGNAVDDTILFPIERGPSRTRLNLRDPLPFEGLDRWTAFEVSWLDSSGIPQVGIATISYPARSALVVESKSLKLFLGGFNFTKFSSLAEVEGSIATSLRSRLQCPEVEVSILTSDRWRDLSIVSAPGVCVDCAQIDAAQDFRLHAGEEVVEETIHSHLLRSLCPVTVQPDWGSVAIYYRGKQLSHASLVGYLLSHRSHQGYHEECCELIFMDLLSVLSPSKLWVGCLYNRRGGIDINPERWLPGTERPRIAGRLARQ